jgi:hypothetical protein
MACSLQQPSTIKPNENIQLSLDENLGQASDPREPRRRWFLGLICGGPKIGSSSRMRKKMQYFGTYLASAPLPAMCMP